MASNFNSNFLSTLLSINSTTVTSITDILSSVSDSVVISTDASFCGRYFCLGNLLIQFNDKSTTTSGSSATYSTLNFPYPYDSTPYSVVSSNYYTSSNDFQFTDASMSFPTNAPSSVNFLAIGPRPAAFYPAVPFVTTGSPNIYYYTATTTSINITLTYHVNNSGGTLLINTTNFSVTGTSYGAGGNGGIGGEYNGSNSAGSGGGGGGGGQITSFSTGLDSGVIYNMYIGSADSTYGSYIQSSSGIVTGTQASAGASGSPALSGSPGNGGNGGNYNSSYPGIGVGATTTTTTNGGNGGNTTTTNIGGGGGLGGYTDNNSGGAGGNGNNNSTSTYSASGGGGGGGATGGGSSATGGDGGTVTGGASGGGGGGNGGNPGGNGGSITTIGCGGGGGGGGGGNGSTVHYGGAGGTGGPGQIVIELTIYY